VGIRTGPQPAEVDQTEVARLYMRALTQVNRPEPYGAETLQREWPFRGFPVFNGRVNRMLGSKAMELNRGLEGAHTGQL